MVDDLTRSIDEWEPPYLQPDRVTRFDKDLGLGDSAGGKSVHRKEVVGPDQADVLF